MARRGTLQEGGQSSGRPRGKLCKLKDVVGRGRKTRIVGTSLGQRAKRDLDGRKCRRKKFSKKEGPSKNGDLIYPLYVMNQWSVRGNLAQQKNGLD